MFETKSLPAGETAAALALAERSRATGEPDVAESVCLDVLAAEPDNQEALVLLVLARTDLLDRGLPGCVDRAREPLSRLHRDYDRAYYHGVICERQARYLLSRRGRRSAFVAFEWFRFAMEQYEEAIALEPGRLEPRLRFNSCVRLIERNRLSAPTPEEIEEHGIE